jgi:hypothetical protein
MEYAAWLVVQAGRQALMQGSLSGIVHCPCVSIGLMLQFCFPARLQEAWSAAREQQSKQLMQENPSTNISTSTTVPTTTAALYQ